MSQLVVSSKDSLISQDQGLSLLPTLMCNLSTKESPAIPVIFLGTAPALPHFKKACKWPTLASEGHHVISRAFSSQFTSRTLEHLFPLDSKKLQTFKAKEVFKAQEFSKRNMDGFYG